MARPLLTVQGFRELQGLFANASKESRKQMDVLEREVAEPVRQTAQSYAVGGIPNIGYGWEQMRVGITRTLVYVAPKKRGVRGRGSPLARPKFATLMDERAMTPAAVRTQPILEQRTAALFAEVARRWGAIE